MAETRNRDSDQPVDRLPGELPAQIPIDQVPIQQPSAMPVDGEIPDLEMGTQWITESYDDLRTKSEDV